MNLSDTREQLYRLTGTRNESRIRLTEVRAELAEFAARREQYPPALVSKRNALYEEVQTLNENISELNSQKIALEQARVHDFQHQRGVREIFCAMLIAQVELGSKQALEAAEEIQAEIANLKAPQT